MVGVEAVIADASGYKKCSCYNRIAFPFIKENNSIMLLSVISKTNDIVATGDSKIILIPDVSVPTEVVTTAKTETCKVNTTTTILKIEELLDQKEGTVFNVIGKVIELDNKMTVNTQWNSTVDVKNGKLADDTATINFAFWRNLANFPLVVGNVVKVNNGQMSKTTTNCPKITGGRFTTLEILPPDLITDVVQYTWEDAFSKTGEVVGITSCEAYKCCSNKRCYKKKIINNICPSCLKESQCDITSVVCSVVINQDDDFKELTLFTPQVEELIQKPISPKKKRN